MTKLIRHIENLLYKICIFIYFITARGNRYELQY